MGGAEACKKEDGFSAPWWVRYTRWRQTSAKEAQYSEKRLLSLLNCNLEVKDIAVGPGKQDYLHTLVGGTDGKPPIVWMPGYAAGTGFFFKNLEGMSKHFKLFAVDWLGTGLSGRPPFKAKTREDAESFFLESLAAWRQQAGLGQQKFILVGHSLGGYLAARYALKYPEHVEHLVLVCPAGIPKAPEDWQDRFLGKGWSLRSTIFKAAMKVWEAGLTPGAVVRGLGPLGERIIHGYVSKRFSHHGEGLTPEQSNVFKHYFYHIAAAPGSGEYALRHLLAPGAWAHAPLNPDLSQLKVPLTFIYGEHDWMRPQHAKELVQRLKTERAPKVASDLHVEVIHDAGHFVFMDQPELFNRALLDACKTYLPGGLKEAEEAAADMHGAHATARTADSTDWGYGPNGSSNNGDTASGVGTSASAGAQQPGAAAAARLGGSGNASSQAVAEGVQWKEAGGGSSGSSHGSSPRSVLGGSSGGLSISKAAGRMAEATLAGGLPAAVAAAPSTATAPVSR